MAPTIQCLAIEFPNIFGIVSKHTSNSKSAKINKKLISEVKRFFFRFFESK